MSGESCGHAVCDFCASRSCSTNSCRIPVSGRLFRLRLAGEGKCLHCAARKDRHVGRSADGDFDAGRQSVFWCASPTNACSRVGVCSRAWLGLREGIANLSDGTSPREAGCEKRAAFSGEQCDRERKQSCVLVALEDERRRGASWRSLPACSELWMRRSCCCAGARQPGFGQRRPARYRAQRHWQMARHGWCPGGRRSAAPVDGPNGETAGGESGVLPSRGHPAQLLSGCAWSHGGRVAGRSLH